MDPETTTVSPDEAKAEQEALAEAKEDEIRSRIVSELGLSEDDNGELVEKLVQREMGHRTRLSAAIRQKINWRDKANAKGPATPAREEGKPPAYDPDAIRKQTEDTVTERLEQRDLDEMDHSDEIKAEIKKLARIQNVSVRKAEKDPYIQHLIEQAKAADRVTEATTTHTPRSTPAQTTGVPKFDLSTEEGRKDYDVWKASRKQ